MTSAQGGYSAFIPVNSGQELPIFMGLTDIVYLPTPAFLGTRGTAITHTREEVVRRSTLAVLRVLGTAWEKPFTLTLSPQSPLGPILAQHAIFKCSRREREEN